MQDGNWVIGLLGDWDFYELRILKIMKKYLLLTFVCILSSTNCIGQTYHPFPDSNAVWSVNLACNFQIVPPYGYDYLTTNYRLGLSDTLINSLTYHKLYMTDSTFTIWSNCYYCAIREDSSKKIYFVPVDSTEEILLYDFNINNIGDTIIIDNIREHPPIVTKDTLVCLQIDTTTIGQNVRHVYYVKNLSNTYQDWWIEGIGSYTGLFEPYKGHSFEAEQWLLCFRLNDTLIYHSNGLNSFFTECYYFGHNPPLGINEIINKPEVFLYFPNPATNKITIETNGKSEIEISNIAGQILKSIAASDNTTTIDISTFAKGMYFVKVKTENGIAVKKFIKQ